VRGGVFQRLESRESFRSSALYVSFWKPEGLDCKYHIIEYSFELVLSYHLLSLHTVYVFLSGCNLSDLWIPEVVEDFLSSYPYFMDQEMFFVSLSFLDVISQIYGFPRWWRICCHLSHISWFNKLFLILFLVWM
jgi:hypothetical protein